MWIPAAQRLRAVVGPDALTGIADFPETYVREGVFAAPDIFISPHRMAHATEGAPCRTPKVFHCQHRAAAETGSSNFNQRDSLVERVPRLTVNGSINLIG